jgi:hypothetical protein
MFTAKNKTDLIIEVWERLDCESVGKEEIVAIEVTVREHFGAMAVDSPMVIARLLADEGADLRHSEIMELYVARATDRPYDAALNGLFDITSLESLRTSLSNAENLRRVLLERKDNVGLRELRTHSIETKKDAMERVNNSKFTNTERTRFAEAVEWITLWLQSPELFENWVKLRRASPEYRNNFLDE